jgi:Fe2+ transport system protein FeoA
MEVKITMTTGQNPLAVVQEGRTVKVKNVHAGFGLMRRLMEMGFIKDAKLRVIKSSYNGPMIVALNNTRFALSRGIAMKIMVEDI